MAKVLGINAVFHDPAAALVLDGETVAAAEEERFTRRKHGKPSVPFATWELPVSAATWCLERGGLEPEDLDAVAYSYDPSLAPSSNGDVTSRHWEGLRSLYVSRLASFRRRSRAWTRHASVSFRIISRTPRRPTSRRRTTPRA
jgi:carbamoyltransferase